MLAAARRLPVAEAVCVLGLLALAAVALGPRPVLLGFAWLALVTPRLVEVDLAEHRLPDAVVLPGYPVVLAAVAAGSRSSGPPVAGVALEAALCGLVFLLLHLAGGMGFGDVKLAPLLGALAAALVPAGGALWLVLAFLAGGVASVAVLVRHGLGARLPFGPPMLLAAWLILLT